ncbi:receptor-transporting protein 3-like [Oxyura jamaicensis]|uniref:receptor-transporting protein 3-like n=1 Tax=Oxyura jamaicensis TaxID=8884 RepID=UPI0015A5A9FC|nr:receptor-transporting protein 3-like [Oxyura jamaicensis]XP_035168051.1 receptor-transporting protein 3-like [Oxyura jamaicensis]
MRTWQKIFAQKVADMHVKEPWTLQEDDSLQVHSPKPGRREYLQNRAAGRFQCSQCLHEWSSAKVHILFHMRRGKVRMRIFRQACRRCLSPQLEEPTFSQENLERILHNLVLQILKDFYKVPVQPSDLLEVVVDTKLAGPHDSSRCEGCQLGVCSKPRAAPKPPAWKPKRHVDTAMSPPRQLLSSGFPRKCCFVLLAVCIVAVVLFIVLYFTLK